VFDRATPVTRVWRSGSEFTLVTARHDAASYGNFANSTLNLFSRAAGTSQFHNGRIAELAIWDGDVSGARVDIGNPGESNSVPNALTSGTPVPFACSTPPLLYVPWTGGDSPEPDYSGNQTGAALTGTSAANHPRTRTLLMPGGTS
jgi:hypothetical protein